MRVLRALWSRLAVIAIGRTSPQTLVEQKRAAWSGMPVKFRRTQRGKVTNLSEWRDRYHRTRRSA